MFGNEIMKDIILKYLIPLPIALTQFYIFILTNCLLNVIDSGNIDLLSNSAIISIFLSVFHFLSIIITDILDIETKILFIFQLSIGILLFLLFVVIDLVLNCKKNSYYSLLQIHYSGCCCFNCDCCEDLCDKCDCCEDCCENCCNDSSSSDCNCFDCDCCDCSCYNCDCDCCCSCKDCCPYNCCDCCCKECRYCCCYCCQCC